MLIQNPDLIVPLNFAYALRHIMDRTVVEEICHYSKYWEESEPGTKQ